MTICNASWNTNVCDGVSDWLDGRDKTLSMCKCTVDINIQLTSSKEGSHYRFFLWNAALLIASYASWYLYLKYHEAGFVSFTKVWNVIAGCFDTSDETG